MSSWIKEYFIDAEHARTALAVVSLVVGAVGFVMVILGALLAG
ncbi:hypothetical protein [Janthinobacterium sp. SUN120]|nr:hypothetical protein [Janthinobacterium sp. SUN120]MDN2713661.1 hypothetical protein [Janthinobacterium sp. SUN120]